MKHILLGLWICILALGGAYGSLMMNVKKEETGDGKAEKKVAVEQVKTKRLSIPIIGDGKINGYVLAQFVFQIDSQAIQAMSIRPDIFLVDEAFKVIFSGEAIDFSSLEKPDANKLSEIIKTNINTRLNKEIVQEVLVQELNYVPQERFRGG